MMWPPRHDFVLAQPAVTLVLGYGPNRNFRRRRVYGKGRKYLREWGL